MKIEIELRGCDDETYIKLDVSDQEYKFLCKIAKLSEEISKSDCMPVLKVVINDI